MKKICKYKSKFVWRFTNFTAPRLLCMLFATPQYKTTALIEIGLLKDKLSKEHKIFWTLIWKRQG